MNTHWWTRYEVKPKKMVQGWNPRVKIVFRYSELSRGKKKIYLNGRSSRSRNYSVGLILRGTAVITSSFTVVIFSVAIVSSDRTNHGLMCSYVSPTSVSLEPVNVREPIRRDWVAVFKNPYLHTNLFDGEYTIRIRVLRVWRIYIFSFGLRFYTLTRCRYIKYITLRWESYSSRLHPARNSIKHC
jgi:hypothetical protein